MNKITQAICSYIWDRLEEREDHDARVECWKWWDCDSETAYKDLKEDPDHGHFGYVEEFEELDKQIYYEGYNNIDWGYINRQIDTWLEEEALRQPPETESSSSDNSPQTSDSE